MGTELTITESTALERHESVIRTGMRTFVEVGLALTAIRDDRLYRGGKSITFEDYCRERWGFERRHAYRLIDGAAAAKNVSNWTQTPRDKRGTGCNCCRHFYYCNKDEANRCEKLDVTVGDGLIGLDCGEWDRADDIEDGELEPAQFVLPANESQVRPLTRISDEKQGEAWNLAVEAAESEGRAVTARDVEDAVVEVMPPESKPHVAQNSGDNEWYTPSEYIESARLVMGGRIDVDPASSEKANDVVRAKSFFTKDENGLMRRWEGTVWMNPPYAQPLCSQFCEKLVEEVLSERTVQACVLVNNATETKWFQKMALISDAVCFPEGRVKFWHPTKVSAPLQGQAILYFGPYTDSFQEMFGQFGLIFQRVVD